MKHVIIHTDGSCLRNPGPGGWAAVLALEGTAARRELCGGFRRTTNNRMEIMAVIAALEALKEPCAVDVYTDSQYVRNAVEKGWLASWRAKNWVKADKKPVLNVDLWQRLAPLLARHEVRLHWLRGHAGHAENERCDELARARAGEPGLPPDTGFVAEDGHK
ncbi:ribonuclease HI [Desulfovibrio sp.]|uniref:ribonuclease HI n=1 Tax=Desulfovibrio sp. TaxID=885 RepID=UPI0023D34DF7|nr:ribonuclease HI [Desulfovibrio sp.]MDE7241484.1 ribonuclease HI [Desulfovibrio sp.]